MAEVVFFYLFSVVAVAAALSVVFNRHPVSSVLSLLVVMTCLASLFVMLGAYFVAALQLLLYAGAVLVLFLFVIMLLNLDRESLERLRPFTWRGPGVLIALVFLLEWLWLIARARAPEPAWSFNPAGSVEGVGRLLFTTYLLPFELTSFLILAAIIGAVTLARSKRPHS